jgi:hypothetical protein
LTRRRSRRSPARSTDGGRAEPVELRLKRKWEMVKDNTAQSLVGVWRLAEARAFDEVQRVATSAWSGPMGVAIFNAERSMAMACNARAALPPDVERSFAAYCGNYTFDETELITRVDGASDPEMLKDQVRHISFDTAARMTVIRCSRLFGRNSGLELIWERVGWSQIPDYWMPGGGDGSLVRPRLPEAIEEARGCTNRARCP